MTRASRQRLQDIRSAIDAIRDHVGGSLWAPRLDRAVVVDAVTFQLTVGVSTLRITLGLEAREIAGV